MGTNCDHLGRWPCQGIGATYRDYVENRHLDVFDSWVRSQGGTGRT